MLDWNEVVKKHKIYRRWGIWWFIICMVLGVVFWMVLAWVASYGFVSFFGGLNKPLEATQPQPAHVCEVTSADLKALMVVIDNKLATRDTIMEGLQRQLYDKQNGVKKK